MRCFGVEQKIISIEKWMASFPVFNPCIQQNHCPTHLSQLWQRKMAKIYTVKQTYSLAVRRWLMRQVWSRILLEARECHGSAPPQIFPDVSFNQMNRIEGADVFAQNDTYWNWIYCFSFFGRSSIKCSRKKKQAAVLSVWCQRCQYKMSNLYLPVIREIPRSTMWMGEKCPQYLYIIL